MSRRAGLFVLAAVCGLALTTACDQRSDAPAAEPAPRPRATSERDVRSLAQALKPRMRRLQNVMVAGRGADGRVITGCVSSPEQIHGLLRGAGNGGH